MSTITVQNRPFSTDLITGLMLPDGIFEATLGTQNINAHFTNVGAATVTGSQVYIESVSHPGLVITPKTHYLGSLAGSASRVLSWHADFSAVPAGTHHISFIVEGASSRIRVIKKIFVTKVQFDAGTKTFRAETPEGLLEVRLFDLIEPVNRTCCKSKRKGGPRNDTLSTDANELINHFSKLFRGHDPNFVFCPPGYLLRNLEAVLTPSPSFSGQYGDLPFEDPWWKVLLAIIAVILLIAAAIVEGTSGTGSIDVTVGAGGTTPDPSGTDPGTCCSVGVGASGHGSSYVAAGLVAAAAVVAGIAGGSDDRDPFRRGQDHTSPLPSEQTIQEKMKMSFKYPEPIVFGKPFAVALDWSYTRVTSGNSYSYSASDLKSNVHILTEYKIRAPEVVRRYRKERFLIEAEFFGEKEQYRGDDLLVQCFLIGPGGENRKIILQDDGNAPDDKPSDGIYTGVYEFFQEENPEGIWRYFVIAQDVNHATPDMKPEEAAKIIGGMVLTRQLTICFDSKECPLVPDGHVNVI